MPRPCNHTSVGMLVEREGKILLIERARFPLGFSIPAGHVDEGENYEDAARRELAEEVGLHAIDLLLVMEGRKNVACRRPGGDWHYWKLYRVVATGEIKGSLEETKKAGWYSREEIQHLSEKTKAFLSGTLSAENWEQSPGLEPIMYEWFKELGLLL